MAGMLFSFVFFTDLGILQESPFEFVVLATMLASFILLIFLYLSSLGLDLNPAEDFLKKFVHANRKKVLTFTNPIQGPTSIITRDFSRLNPLLMEQVVELSQDNESHSSTTAKYTEQIMIYKDRLGIDFVRNSKGKMTKKHFEPEMLGNKPFVFEFAMPMHHALILTPHEQKQLANSLPGQVKGFRLKHNGDMVSVRTVIDEHTLSSDPKGVYNALVTVKKAISSE